MIDLPLTTTEIDTIDRATRWISLNDSSGPYLRSFVVSSLTDLELAGKVSRLTPAQVELLFEQLRTRRGRR
jgi:hypothetical protein